jgi:ATP/maltotriose-dependent transcriptional regulator MalT
MWFVKRLRSNDAPIILDDFQRFKDDPAARAFIVRLIEATAPNTRWIISSRETPDVPLGTWISRGWMMLPITGADLAFTVEEARDLAASLGLAVPESDLQTIVADAEGWPLVVRLTLDAWQRSPALPPVRIRTRDDLFEFLETQVWQRTSVADQRLLLAVAMVDRAQPTLFEAAGFERSGSSLDAIARRSPLLRRLSEREFRLHELFRRFILERHGDEVERRAVLTQLVSTLVQYGQISDALSVSMRALAHDLVVATLGECGAQLVDEGQRAVVEAALRSLPKFLHDSPVVLAVRGYLHAANGDVKVAEDEMRAVSAELLPPALSRALCFRHSYLALQRGAPDVAKADLVRYLEDQDFSVRAEALAQSALGMAMKGESTDARSLVVRLLPLLDVVPLDLRGRLYGILANAEFFLNNYGEAEKYALTAVEFATKLENQIVLRMAYATLASTSSWMYADSSMSAGYGEKWLELARTGGNRADHARALVKGIAMSADRGEDDRYAELLAELRRLMVKPDPRFDVPLRWAMVIHEVGHGRSRDAAILMSQCVVAPEMTTSRDFADALTGLCWAMAGEESQAVEYLDSPTLRVAPTMYDGYIGVNAAAYRALAWWVLGKTRMATRMQPVIPREVPESLAAVVSCIRSICSTPMSVMTSNKLELCLSPLRAFEMEGQARFLRAAFRPSTSKILTPTQLNILREVRAGKTTQAIAEKLRRSPRTVEWHVEEACKVLGCEGRFAAAVYAEERGWL